MSDEIMPGDGVEGVEEELDENGMPKKIPSEDEETEDDDDSEEDM